ncbi:MAG: hypothetical protein MJZ01_03795 [Bacteroidales bacterium]|nr:hypothetical protein [Bacteroidales bacterium]
MAKQMKFSTGRLAAELLASGDATSSKVEYILMKLSSVAQTIICPSDKAEVFSLANVAEALLRSGFTRNRLAHQPTAPDGVERLVIKFPNMQIRLALRILGSGREISCTYLTGSARLTSLVSANAVTEFIKKTEIQHASWLTDWELILFQGWQSAREMEKHSEIIEQYLLQKESFGFKHKLNMQVNYAEVALSLPQGLKLVAKVPHTKFENAIDMLFKNASELNNVIVAIPEDMLLMTDEE